uniref:ATPase subunit 8 n=1 Tax=Halamphora calidilacuna TaxID=2133758 RepID=A0A2R4A3Q6_9STRA|nr:ATPase subunit 8 [Halamphora calidilacuna]
MAQFDSLIIFPLIWSLIIVLAAYYRLSIEILIPQFAGIGKFREKKLNSLDSFNSFNTSLISKVNNTILS